MKQLYKNGETQFICMAHVAGCMGSSPTVRVEKCEGVVDNIHRTVSFQSIYFFISHFTVHSCHKNGELYSTPWLYSTWHAMGSCTVLFATLLVALASMPHAFI